MVTYHPHCGDHVPGLTAAATLLVMFGVPDPFPTNSKPASASASITAAPRAGGPVCGKGEKPARPSAEATEREVAREGRGGGKGKNGKLVVGMLPFPSLAFPSCLFSETATEVG